MCAMHFTCMFCACVLEMHFAEWKHKQKWELKIVLMFWDEECLLFMMVVKEVNFDLTLHPENRPLAE